jgi:nucleotide-binding universal stress UspA family protein
MQASEGVLNWVLENIYRKDDEIHLLHIIPIPMPEVVAGGYGAMDSIVTVDPDPKEDLKHIADAKEMMKRRFVTKVASKDIPYRVEIVHFLTDADSIGEAICKRAEGLDASVVCMAKHNRGKISEFFLGSTTKYCTTHCKCPLVVLH